MPRLDALAGAIYHYLSEDCSGNTSLLIFWFRLTFMLRVAVLRWILLGNVLCRVALALISRRRDRLRIGWVYRSHRVMLALLLLWISFSFVSHNAPFPHIRLVLFEGMVS